MVLDELNLVGVEEGGALLTRDIAAFAEFDEETEGSLPPLVMPLLLGMLVVVLLLGCGDDDKFEVGDIGEV